MTRIRVLQQFGAAGMVALAGAQECCEIVEAASGPAGWDMTTDVLLAGPTRFWRDQPRPAGWPGQTRWIQLPGTGIDGYPAWVFEVPCVTAAPALHALAIAEFAVACMLAFEKRMPQLWIQAPEQWRTRAMGSLRGRTLALAGAGAIGSAVARHALHFGMRVIALRRSSAVPMPGVDVITDRMQLAALADHLVLCLPSTTTTRHLVDANFLAACKTGLHLVNVARGDLVDQDALLRALDDGTVACASLDVATPEPLPTAHSLYTHPRVHLSPHVAWNSPDSVDRLLDLFQAQLQRFAHGQAPLHAVSST